MPARSAWKSALIYLGLLLTIIGLPWALVSVLRPLNSTEYEPISFQVAVNFIHWGGLSWLFYVIFFATTLYFAVMGFNIRFYRHYYFAHARIDVAGPMPKLVAAYGAQSSAPKWKLADLGGNDFQIKQVSISIPMRMQPIADNPKVRRLTYEIQFASATNTASAEHTLQLVTQASKVSNQGRIDGDGSLKEALERWLKYHLYIFNERNSRHLGELFNPLDNEQQKAFWDLINDYFIPIVAGSGLMVQRAKFDLT